jgi:hypothetical protein
MDSRSVRAWSLLALALAVACGARSPLEVISEASSPPDAGIDASPDRDASPDVVSHIDASVDAPVVDASPPPDAPDDCGTSLASGPLWMTPFGPAQDVCLNVNDPPGCPNNNAFFYGGGPGWSADISQLGGAAWIWRPGIAITDPSDLVQVTFTRTFELRGAPSGTLQIAADDFAEVDVNGIFVGAVGSITDVGAAGQAQSTLTAFDLSPYLVGGQNVITIRGQNGPPSFGGCPMACDYAQNPAGVVFGGSLECQ